MGTIGNYSYSDSHEWVSVHGDIARVGISNYAQEELGTITFVELPEEGKFVHKGDVIAVIESVKIASDIHAPISGTVVRTNPLLLEHPSRINTSPRDEGWLVEIRLAHADELHSLLTEEAYEAFLHETPYESST